MTDGSDHGVLVVEDEHELAELYAAWLGEAYSVETAYDGREAIDLLDGSVDVVLLDRRMPGLSGDEVLERIREQAFDCRVAMVTAVEPDFDIIGMGFDDYLVKPVDRDRLHEAVERLVARNVYDERVDELAALIAKKSALEAEKPGPELEASEEFSRLEARIEELRPDVDRTARNFGDEDVAALLRDTVARG